MRPLGAVPNHVDPRPFRVVGELLALAIDGEDSDLPFGARCKEVTARLVERDPPGAVAPVAPLPDERVGFHVDGERRPTLEMRIRAPALAIDHEGLRAAGDLEEPDRGGLRG